MDSPLRFGYTTGACAAAAAKAAVMVLFTDTAPETVKIPFPDRSRVSFPIAWSRRNDDTATAAVVKDGGDDPDATNGALIVALATRVKIAPSAAGAQRVSLTAGKGVGRVGKPGLAVAVGLPAINPVPRNMIREAVSEVLAAYNTARTYKIEVCITVPDGEKIAEKTLNKRLGIIGGISILGTTGIVKPISAEAWTATISTSMDVAEATGVREIIMSTGRTSERCLQRLLDPPEEALVMMGDYLDFSLRQIRNRSFTRVHMAAMWAKLLKGAMKYPHTHVRYKVLEIDDICRFLRAQGTPHTLIAKLSRSHTAREMLTRLLEAGEHRVIEKVCDCARNHYETIAGVPVVIYLVNGSGELLCTRP